MIDKHAANLAVLARMHPDVVIEHADLAEPGTWERHFAGADAVVMLQAQIGGTDPLPFVRNNITATDLILDAIEPRRALHGARQLLGGLFGGR